MGKFTMKIPQIFLKLCAPREIKKYFLKFKLPIV